MDLLGCLEEKNSKFKVLFFSFLPRLGRGQDTFTMMCSKVYFFHRFAVAYNFVKSTEKRCQWKDTASFWLMPFILSYITPARVWNRLTLLSWIVTKVQVNKDQAPCLNCQSWPWCWDYFFQSQFLSLSAKDALSRSSQDSPPSSGYCLLLAEGPRALLTWCQSTKQCPAPWGFAGLQISPPLKHTVLDHQETAGSDSVLLPNETIGICVWLVSAGCHNHSRDFHWVWKTPLSHLLASSQRYCSKSSMLQRQVLHSYATQDHQYIQKLGGKKIITKPNKNKNKGKKIKRKK